MRCKFQTLFTHIDVCCLLPWGSSAPQYFHRHVGSPKSVCLRCSRLMVESNRVKQQLRSLERQINDLKLATQDAAMNEGDKLTHELQLIEQNIREKEKEVRLVSWTGSQ